MGGYLHFRKSMAYHSSFLGLFQFLFNNLLGHRSFLWRRGRPHRHITGGWFQDHFKGVARLLFFGTLSCKLRRKSVLLPLLTWCNKIHKQPKCEPHIFFQHVTFKVAYAATWLFFCFCVYDVISDLFLLK